MLKLLSTAALLFALLCAPARAAILPDVYRDVAASFITAIVEGRGSGLCDDDGDPQDLGSGLIMDGSGRDQLRRVGWTTLDAGGEAPLLIVGARARRGSDTFIYGVWCVKDGVPRKLLASSRRDRFTVRMRNDASIMLYAVGDQGPDFSYEGWIVLDDSFRYDVLVTYNRLDHPSSPWQLNGTPCTERAARDAAARMAGLCTPLYLSLSLFDDLKLER